MNTPFLAARRARREIERVRKQLLRPTPQIVAECVGPLEEAIVCMTKLQESLTEPLPLEGAHQLRHEIGQIRRELLQAKALLQAAGAYYQELGRLLGLVPEIEEVNYGAARSPVRVGPTRVKIHG